MSHQLYMAGIFSCSDGLLACLFYVKEGLHSVTGRMGDCSVDEGECRNAGEALNLKVGAIVAILVAGILGVALPLLGKRLKFLKTGGSFFFVAKALAAGVILATAFVHILPDAMLTLRSECLPDDPWRRFPFASFIAMMAALGTLLVDFVSTEFYDNKHSKKERNHDQPHEEALEADTEAAAAAAGGSATTVSDIEKQVTEEDQYDQMHIVGMHAHAASHAHSHSENQNDCGKQRPDGHFGHSHFSNTSLSDDDNNEIARVRHVVVSQVLELGIITHSIIIGLSLGVSESPCTIRPLLGALSCHQFFEGFALGGCISQAGFKPLSVLMMAACFAITTPSGIAVGIGISNVYNSNSPIALIVEGVFYSVSAGILIYMALVNLIAADFLSKRMRCDRKLQITSFLALLLGVGIMSVLALWA